MANGVSKAVKKDGTVYYRSSITYRNKHISLGSYHTYEHAHNVYLEGLRILNSKSDYYVSPEESTCNYTSCSSLISLEKFIILVNFRDNNIYFKNPIYLCHNYFVYFLNLHTVLRFDTDDIFFYAKHHISCRGGYYYVSEYGMQTSILSRYGIRKHAVCGQDYIFKNGDINDYRYQNVLNINKYYGVKKIMKHGRILYSTRIHINGDFIVGCYPNEIHAAIAYNKAADSLNGLVSIEFPRNYIESINSIQYASIYNNIILKKKYRDYVTSLSR